MELGSILSVPVSVPVPPSDSIKQKASFRLDGLEGLLSIFLDQINEIPISTMH